MENQLQIFKYERFGNIRTVMGDDGDFPNNKISY